ncbi:hypothetical protein CAEBREN_22622 [Caenorhabditis brenneri]|uniref:Uncharacterized protein n=1 Tax=Caenorhabditis brenneri TaxID=135651 RepID=G0PDW7_CAEBE|nr:hypothetical protein CAEBREN_22622 [Caenorhabditis brenneri]
MDNNNTTIVATVLWQNDVSLDCLVRCNEPGNDGILTPNPENPVHVGDWVAITLNKQEYDKYISGDMFPRFKATNYVVLPEFSKTTAELTDNQRIINHDFFGKIHNEKEIKFPTGTGTIRIQRVLSNNLGMAWVLEEVESVQQPPRDIKIPIVGIVVSHHNEYTYVWCKERPVGFDVTLKKSSDGTLLPVGSWITFSVEKDTFEAAFSGAFLNGGYVQRYEIQDFDIMENPLHPTVLTGVNQTTVNLKLECVINANSQVEDISHPFVGLIINQRFSFKESGTYSITVVRAKKTGDLPKSVWILKSRELVLQATAPSSQPVQEASLERQVRFMSMDNLSTNQPRASLLVHQTRPSDDTRLETSPVPAPRQCRSSSRQRRSPSRQNRSASRPRQTQVIDTAIIYKVKKFEGGAEIIYVWLLKQKIQAKLNPEAADKHDLKLGSVFSAEFILNGYSCTLIGPVNHNPGSLYEFETKEDGWGGILIHVHSEVLKNAGMVGNKYPVLCHPHFGDIIDSFKKITLHDKTRYHVWTARRELDGDFQWNKHTHQCYIWCKETYVGNDGILIPNPENPVKMGDWVAITFTRTEYQAYFSDDKTKKLPKFEAKSYVVIPEIYKTTVDGATIRVKLQQALTENQNVIDHHFFGNIYNNVHLNYPSGTWTITIRRVEPGNRDSVWVLENVESVQEPPSDTKIKVIGIVVSHHNEYTYVWCKERPVSHDVTIKKPAGGSHLPLGTWIMFTVEKYIFEKSFPVELPSNGFVPRYEIEEYDVMEKPIHPTELTGKDLKTVSLKLEVFIEKNVIVENIWNPFIGLIINESYKFPVSGKYAITVIRAKPNGYRPKSIWFLRNRELVLQSPTTEPPQPVRPETTLERQLRYMSMDNLSTNQPSSSNQATLPRPSRLVHQPRPSDDTQSMFGFSTRASNQPSSSTQSGLSRHRPSDDTQSEAPPIPTPRRRRSPSRPRRSVSRRRRSASRPRGPPVVKTVIIYKMLKNEEPEIIFVWLLDDHEQGLLKLKVPAEKHDLELGSVFTADFFLSGDTWISNGPVKLNHNRDYKYETRENGQQGIDIRIYADTLKNAGTVGNKYPTIFHHHFGDIVSF